MLLNVQIKVPNNNCVVAIIYNHYNPGLINQFKQLYGIDVMLITFYKRTLVSYEYLNQFRLFHFYLTRSIYFQNLNY